MSNREFLTLINFSKASIKEGLFIVDLKEKSQ